MKKNKRLWLLLGIFALILVVVPGVYRTLSLKEASRQESEPKEEMIIKSQESAAVEVSESESHLAENSSEEESSKEPQTANLPTTQVPNTHLLNADGEEVRLHDFLGKPLIINIWASWCPPCREEMPGFQANYDEYSEQVNFIMLQATESRSTETIEKGKQFAEEAGLTFPVYHDPEFENQITFGVNMLPMTLILDEEGYLLDVIRGGVSQAQLKALIEKSLQP